MKQAIGFENKLKTFIIMDFYLDYILDLPGVKVESCTQIDGKILLGLRIVGEGMVCHHCQNYTEQLHQNRPILVKDLPVFGRPVYLKVPRRQFYCPNCQRYPTEKLDFLDYILDLPGVKVESCTQIDGKILLGLRIVGEGMVCHHCQNYTEQLHQNRPILVKDLPVFGRPVYLKVPRRQFYCPNCQRYPTEKLDFLDIKRRHTQRYEQNIYERVKQSSMEQIGRELGLRIVGEGMVCHHCQNYTEQLHQNRPILVKDLPVFGRPVYLKVPRRQFYCPNCQRYPTEKLDFLDIKRRHTQRYEQNIYERVKQSSMEQIGREEGLSYDEIKGIFDRVNKTQKKPNWEQVKRICLDEISMRKGQGNFVTVVADISEGNLIEMIDSHRSEEIIEVLMKQAIEVREQVEEVSIDMWGGFPKVIKKVFPNAEIIIDRFHVMKVVNKDLNKLRRAAGITDRQSKYLLLSNRVNLKPEQIDKLEVVLGKSECLKIAYEMKEKFREIYESNLTVKKGQKKIQEWLNHAQVFFRESASTIENHLEGICNYFLNRTTSGVMEGINNRIKLIMRQGYGFSNFNNFRNRVLACFSD
ncbi:ISL3 family transposase [Nostoc punctiforme]|uniref:ISL3 family transposase n=1 Tax=Nostoc punctiforme TaxID=272131 RepID=UPI003CC856A6